MASPRESKADENEVTSEQRNQEQELEFGGAIPLRRQSSIYSLTLDEIQNTVCEPGKCFGSMNMDEFLNNIWNVEEAGINNNNNNASAAANPTATTTNPPNAGRAPPLHRQGSLTIPAPLCRKTVEEVWAEIHKLEQEVEHVFGRGQPQAQQAQSHQNAENGAHPRQPTFGEMTLEDFLIKAGVVREGLGLPSPHNPMNQGYGLSAGGYQDYGHVVGPGGYEYHPHAHAHPHQHQIDNGKRYGNGYGMSVGSPASPASSNGLWGGQVESTMRYGGSGGGAEENGAAKVNGVNGRKRGPDRGVEKVVERRQRRMIKNRESAARSRARKQAYTVELEAELNLLKEENARLQEEERRARAVRKQMIAECMAEHARTNTVKAARSLRRCNSGPW